MQELAGSQLCAMCILRERPRPRHSREHSREDRQVSVRTLVANVDCACPATVTVKVFYGISSRHSHSVTGIFTDEKWRITGLQSPSQSPSGMKPGLEAKQCVSRARA